MYFKYDLKVGFLKDLPKLLIFVGIVLVANISLFRYAELFSLNLGSLDYILYLTKSIAPFPQSGEEFRFPVVWYLIQLYLAWIVGKYPFSSVYDNHGTGVLIYGGSRSKWYLSKVVWIALTVLAYYLVMIITSLAFCLVAGVPISWEINILELTEEFSSVALFLSIVTSFVTGVFELFLMTLTTPIISFFAVAVISAASTYVTSPILFTNCSQLLKLSAFSVEGIGTAESYLTLAIVFILSLAAGLIIFNRRDILKSQRDEE
ncbi:MAG: hypothetical protein LUG23_04380 [Oscillospiraceae bacterium]|nr:hypothetical protein [Oscillospiraceae bacterium]